MSDPEFIPRMPDGTPAPHILTQEEAIVFLRIDASGIQNPARSILHLRETGKLQGVRIGRRILYPLTDLIRFVRENTGTPGAA